ncbi:MAG: acetyl-CoA carboxylase biotin carboxyl carrier protein [Synechocystis sp.]|nr:acetyl-CoA carboxylase biotin carboxyl carrier protein [Synechocystis sp.]
MSIDFTELQALLGVISQSNIAEFSLKTDQFELSVTKVVNAAMVAPLTANTAPQPFPVAPAGENTSSPASAPPPANGPGKSATLSPAEQKWIAITSPMVGTFYRAPAPDEDPFVETGDAVSKGQVVCIIEAMKLMNEIEAEATGQVMEILVENGEPVEYGQTLMWIKP